ncbi:MAG: DUF1015 domain-containing protein [Planctomycetes bacterium]|nr:DUF1015 domain-containing protein [Planctomycetota bacterium]
MAKIFPFRGVLYNKKKVKDYGLVLTQPYDKIDDKMQAGYYRKHPYNLIRITKGKETKGDSDGNNKYTRAGRFFRDWQKKGVLAQDKKPAIYAYYEEFKPYGMPNAPVMVRKGFIALGRLVELGKPTGSPALMRGKGVHAHERTLLKPKMDRLNTMRQVHGSTGQIFMLYSDPTLTINKIMDSVAGRRPDATVGTPLRLRKPDVVAKDEYGVAHKLWKITQPTLVNRIVKSMAAKDIFIADGHHRYETALNYRNEMRAKGLKCTGNESYDNRMMTFVNMDDEGLLILPTHRLIFGLKLSLRKFLARLNKYFWLNEYPFSAYGKESETARTEMMEDLRITGYSAHAFGLAIKGVKKYFLLTLKDESIMDKVIKEKGSPALKHLDVNILHQLILWKLLGITKEKVAEDQYVNYVRAADEAVESVRQNKYQMTFILNPTKISELKKVSAKNERMPQKSTDFYPKLLSGIVISKINYK